jgi:hypothetical protein
MSRHFRRQITRGELSFEEISKRRASVYGAYAQAMNEIETWTGKLNRFKTGQDIDIYWNRLSIPYHCLHWRRINMGEAIIVEMENCPSRSENLGDSGDVDPCPRNRRLAYNINLLQHLMLLAC